MVTANLNELELHTGTVEGNPAVEAHFAFPMFWATGNASTAEAGFGRVDVLPIEHVFWPFYRLVP